MKRHDSLRFAGGVVTGVLCAAGLLFTSPGFADNRHDRDDDDDCYGKRAIRLVNGRIHTMDKRDRVVSSVLIEDGKFAGVGGHGMGGSEGCTTVINLRGRKIGRAHV